MRKAVKICCLKSALSTFSILFLFSICEIFKSILFLFLIFKIFKKKFSFSSRLMRFWNTNLFLFSIFKIFRKKSLSLLDLWDFWKQFSFSSQFSRFLETNIKTSQKGLMMPIGQSKAMLKCKWHYLVANAMGRFLFWWFDDFFILCVPKCFSLLPWF